jgi:hypothetical protein
MCSMMSCDLIASWKRIAVGGHVMGMVGLGGGEHVFGVWVRLLKMSGGSGEREEG